MITITYWLNLTSSPLISIHNVYVTITCTINTNHFGFSHQTTQPNGTTPSIIDQLHQYCTDLNLKKKTNRIEI